VQPALDDLFGQFRFARAVELASHGKTREAEAILRSKGARSLTAGELDLLARIAVKENRFGDARSLWIEAVRLAPENLGYEECLGALAEAERDAMRRTTIFTVSGATAFVVAVACIWWIFEMPHKSAGHPVPAHLATVPGQTSTVRPASTNSLKPSVRPK